MRKVPTARLAGAPTVAQIQRDYNRHRRDREATAFYHSTPWLRLRLIYLADHPYCEPCLARGDWTPATTVHHKIERSERPDLALDESNLEAVCSSCHAIEHARRRREQSA